ncbi:MAG: hypothetical protein PWQ20_512 [Thermotogaceae bacterium]|nr:hypothetical protein [Thermotogaceae bacterium]MDN5337442.1 hypothetical protein [Thermotogaceae bacterium]
MEKYSFTHSEININEIHDCIALKRNLRINLEKLEEIAELSFQVAEEGHNVFLILSNEREVMEMHLNMSEYSDRVFSFPAHDILPFELVSSSVSERSKRINTLFNLYRKENGIYITSFEGALQKTVPPENFPNMFLVLKEGFKINEEFFDKLKKFGYERVETVREIGEFARRGFVIDVFSPYHDKPVRIELLDDEIIELRTFDPDTQRSISKIRNFILLPVHEYILDRESLNNFEKEIEDLKKRFPKFQDFLERLTIDLSVLDPLSGIFYRSSACIVDYVERIDNTVVIIKDVLGSLKNFYDHREAIVDLYGDPFYNYLYHRFSKFDPEVIIRGRFSKIFLANQVEDIPFEYYKEFTPRFEKRKTRIKLKSLPEFLKIPTKPLEDWEELKEGDYVVHKDYGIGKFIGIKKITNQFGTKEYFELLYSNNTKLYVPVERMHRLHRYIGNVEEIKLGNLSNTSNWERTKKKAREEIEKKVQELLKIYALRLKMTKKPSLGDQELESRFFESFPHVETEDQLKVTEEILNDMADIKPMDRLLCGDSGAGKTEVAMRAAFRAVVSGKQVAFLVPTTILAKQHYLNFKDRMEKFGVKIEFLDRLKTSKEIEKILKELENGSIDIIIGTHRLLSKDVKLKNLGLVIIDEEHRFGVAQKEKLKKHRLTVDVLSLSATPIPRTLYMSLSGIRDISVIKTLPPGRVPVEIIVSKYDQRIVKTAILREISRGGQVLYVHNRVRDLDDVLLKLREMFPDLKIDIAHGQMSKRHFDRVISDFYDGKLDVLISTTIVENGVDVPNANTLIVDDAHRYGLAQLYQIRGRVGRGNRRAFAYFLYPSNLKLKNEAAERLNAIREFGKPGGGFKLSLKDMEIRGIGNVFGFEQHGHINAIGLYMYREMLENVLKKYRGDETLNELEENIIDVELKGFKMDVLIPQDYIPDSLERMKIYRKIAQSRNCDEINDIEKELRDRFGKIPDSVFNLLDYARIRIMASKYGVNRISLENSTLKFGFEEEEQARNVYKIITNGTVLDGELIIYNFHFKEPVKKLLEILSKLQKEVIDCSIQ